VDGTSAFSVDILEEGSRSDKRFVSRLSSFNFEDVISTAKDFK
jgi:hypothetical protein